MGELVKVPGLSGQGKMSKSAGESDCIYLSEEAAVLNKKIMKAVTVTVEGATEFGSEKPEAVQNLFDLMKLVSSSDIMAHFEKAFYDGSIRFGDMKKQLAEDMEGFIAPKRNAIKDDFK
jgi:tryptophanyl-tRNA synthetase